MKLIQLLLCIFAAVCGVDASNSMARFKSSTCGSLLSRMSPKNLLRLESILPDISYWDFIHNSSTPVADIMLVDVDMHTWPMLSNQAAALKKAGSHLVVQALAYDNNSCHSLIKHGVPCYYDATWLEAMQNVYTQWTGHEIDATFKTLSIVMMGRMVASLVTLCEGHNVFLSDGDVIFYRDPLSYVFDHVNLMITATMMSPSPEWGAKYFIDQPNNFFTLNNGVVFYRSNPVTRSFLLTLTGSCITHLSKGPDRQFAFLQTTFNRYMHTHKLKFHPSRSVPLLFYKELFICFCFILMFSFFFLPRGVSNSTFQLNTNIINPVGECYDCYHGEISVPAAKFAGITTKRITLRAGVFPMERFTSLCSASNITGNKLYPLVIPIFVHIKTKIYLSGLLSVEYENKLKASALALKSGDKAHWRYGELPNGGSRLLAVHANCINAIDNADGYTVARFGKKAQWFRSINSWFLSERII